MTSDSITENSLVDFFGRQERKWRFTRASNRSEDGRSVEIESVSCFHRNRMSKHGKWSSKFHPAKMKDQKNSPNQTRSDEFVWTSTRVWEDFSVSRHVHEQCKLCKNILVHFQRRTWRRQNPEHEREDNKCSNRKRQNRPYPIQHPIPTGPAPYTSRIDLISARESKRFKVYVSKSILNDRETRYNVSGKTWEALQLPPLELEILKPQYSPSPEILEGWGLRA